MRRAMTLGAVTASVLAVAALPVSVFAAGTTPATGPAYTLSVVAGNGQFEAGPPVAGPAMSSPMAPGAVARDSAGDLFIVSGNTYVLKVTTAGVLSIIGGNGSNGKPVAGPSASSPMSPGGVVVDAAGNLYVVDESGYILKLTPSADGSAYTQTVIAGIGNTTAAPDNGPATQVAIAPDDLAIDSAGNVFVSDRNGYIEKLTPSVDGSSYTLAVIAGWHSAGGWSQPTPPVDGGPALDAPVYPYGIAVDNAGDLFVGEANQKVAELKPVGDGTYTIAYIAGTGTVAPPVSGAALDSPVQPVIGDEGGVAVDPAGYVYVSDGQGYVDKLTANGDGTYNLSVTSGGGDAMNRDTPGPATNDALEPRGLVATTNGPLFMADAGGVIAQLTPNFMVGANTTVAGKAAVGNVLAVHSAVLTPTATVAYRWLRNGAPITGATGSMYRLASADEHHAISVRATYARAGYETLTQRVDVTSSVAPGTFTIIKAGYLTGYSIVGRWLTAHPAGLRPGASQVTYQWLRNGHPISGATSAAYHLRWADYRQSVAVRITYRRAGYTTLVRTTLDGRRIAA